MKPGPLWGKKDKQCDSANPDDAEQGSYWDHVIIDPESKLIVSLVVGRRNADTVVQLFTDFYQRSDGYLPELITTDEYAVYETVILDTYGVWRAELELTAAEEAAFDRQGMPAFYFPVEITYARVLKEKEGNRVVQVMVERRAVQMGALRAVGVLGASMLLRPWIGMLLLFLITRHDSTEAISSVVLFMVLVTIDIATRILTHRNIRTHAGRTA